MRRWLQCWRWVRVHLWVFIIALVATWVAILCCGLWYSAAERLPNWHGVFCAVANAATDGCDLPPRTGWGYAVDLTEYMLAVPLWGLTFSIITALITSVHIHQAKDEIKDHVTEVVTPTAPDQV